MFQTQSTWPRWLVLIGLFTSFVTAAANATDQSGILQAAELGDLSQYRQLKAQGADLRALGASTHCCTWPRKLATRSWSERFSMMGFR